MSKQKIEFTANSKHVFEVRERPKPASSFVPQWWKDMSMYSYGNKLDLNPYPNVTAKKCFPLLDGITAGYIVTLWADLLVKDVDGFSGIKWTTEMPVAEAWSPEQSKDYEIPEGFTFPVYKYFHGWIPKTPPGYSCLIIHPVGYQNLPFRTLTGIIDTDTLRTNANSPFVIKKGFQGIIEQGTPMFQIIPFKRDEWESTFTEQSEEEYWYEKERFYSRFVSRYGKDIRSKKSYF